MIGEEGRAAAGEVARVAAPWSERLCEALCLGFAGWTLCAHAVVALGGSLVGLMLLFALTAGLALRFLRLPTAAAADGDALPPEAVAAGVPPRVARAAAAPAWLALGLGAWTSDPSLRWALWVTALGAAAVVYLWRDAPCFPAPHRSRSAELALGGLALLGALYALALHRPDADDSLYVNMAVSAVDLPELPLLAHDTLHGRFDLPIVLPSYKLHSWELWNGALAWLTGLPAIAVFHLISAPCAAALLPLAHAVLFRQLTPAIWPATTAALVLVLVSVGETHRWYGNFAFVRMWQGKAVMLFVFVPLVYAYALRFARLGDARSWGLLAAAQIAALGCSANALWLAPAAALSAQVCALRPTRDGARRLAVGALSSAYVIAAGLLLKVGTTESVAALAEPTHPIWGGAPVEGAKATPLKVGIVTVLGESRLQAVGLVSALLAWLACPPGPARRFAIGVPLAVGLVLLSPWLAGPVIEHLTGPTFWRTMWALPVPVLIALVLVSPLRRPGWPGRLGCLGLIAAFAIAVPQVRGHVAANRGELAWPGLKVGPGYRWAESLARVAPRRTVVAPPGPSAWAPTLHDAPYPLIVRHYLDNQVSRIGETSLRERLVMSRFVDGTARHPSAAAVFERGLTAYGVRAVLLRITPATPAAREILRRSGFRRALQGTEMEIWVRDQVPLRG